MQVTTPSAPSQFLKEGRQLVMQADEGKLMMNGQEGSRQRGKQVPS